MARPKVDDLRASSSFSYDATKGILTGSGGNPHLKPFRANAVDLSYEKYFGTKAYVGVAGFYKQMSHLHRGSLNPNYDFSRYVTPSTVIPPGFNLIGEFKQPINGSGGRISGIELSGNFPLNMLTNWLDGFGVFASMSSTSSSLNLNTSGVATDGVNTGSIPLPGLSKRVSNIAVYFEKWGFSARVAARSRSDFVGEVTDGVGDRKLTYIKGETITDARSATRSRAALPRAWPSASRSATSTTRRSSATTRQRHQRGREQEGRQVLPVRHQLQALTASGRPSAAALLFFDPLPARPTRGFF
jgi:iron complex outermembrane receptor protein